MHFQPATRRTRCRALVLLTGLALFGPVAAAQASGDDVWHDCALHSAITGSYSQAEYRDALANPPADGTEYAGFCASLIRQAQNKAAGTGSKRGVSYGKPPGIGVTRPPVSTASLSKALQANGITPPTQAGGAPAKAAAPAPVTVDGKRIDLAAVQAPSIADATSLPLPLALSAVALVLVALGPLGRRLTAWRAAKSGRSGGDA